MSHANLLANQLLELFFSAVILFWIIFPSKKNKRHIVASPQRPISIHLSCSIFVKHGNHPK